MFRCRYRRPRRGERVAAMRLPLELSFIGRAGIGGWWGADGVGKSEVCWFAEVVELDVLPWLFREGGVGPLSTAGGLSSPLRCWLRWSSWISACTVWGGLVSMAQLR